MTILKLEHVRKTSGNTTLLPHISLSIHEGQCTAIQCNPELGNRLIYAIAGQVPLSEGQILFQGNVMSKGYFEKVQQQIGIQFLQDAAYDRLTVRDQMNFFARLYGVKLGASELEMLLTHIGLSDKLNTRADRLNPSERRRLMIGRAIVHQPKLVILEEPEQNADLETVGIIRNLLTTLQKQGKAVLVTTTVLEQAISISEDVYIYNHQGLKKIETVEEDTSETEAEAAASIEDLVQAAEASNPEEDIKQEIPITVRPVRIEKIPAKVGDKIMLFDPTEIDYIESHEGVSNLHVLQGVFACALTLSELEDKLKPFGFFRCHRSYLVNLQKVREVITWTRNSFSLILEDNKKSSIPLSKGKMDELKQILGF